MATVEVGQSLLDIAVQQSGSLEGLLSIAIQNSISITDAIPAGSSVDVALVVSKPVADFFRVNGVKPATGITDINIAQTISDEGIEFWAIEEDFIVS